jgi:hypothetical protein
MTADNCLEREAVAGFLGFRQWDCVIRMGAPSGLSAAFVSGYI